MSTPDAPVAVYAEDTITGKPQTHLERLLAIRQKLAPIGDMLSAIAASVENATPANHPHLASKYKHDDLKKEKRYFPAAERLITDIEDLLNHIEIAASTLDKKL
jgi:hypothetical protein